MFTVVFSILGLIFRGALGLDSYGAAIWYFLIFGEGLRLFGLLVIDLLWRRNTRRIRFSFLPKRKPIRTRRSMWAPSCGGFCCLRLSPP